MEDNKRLSRVFDRVRLSREREEAMLADLLDEKKEVSLMKQTNNRRRFPAAVLAAAALAAALAGTALAAEYFGRVDIDFIGGWTDGVSEVERDAYAVRVPEARVAVESLSEEVLAACPEKAARPNCGGHIYFPFDSWSDGETFLGLELADNARLEGMDKRKIRYPSNEDPEREEKSHCLADVDYFEGLPVFVRLAASYKENNCMVHAQALVPMAGSGDRLGGEYGLSVPLEGETDFREYVMPNGTEATIYSQVVAETYPTGSYDDVIYRAHFIRNGALFCVEIYSTEAWQTGREGQEFLDPWEVLIEILDAYE